MTEKTMNFSEKEANFYSWNSKQLRDNNVKTDFVKQENENVIVESMERMDFDILWKKGDELTVVKNGLKVAWNSIGIQEEELHYLKKKSWVVIDWVQEQGNRLGLQLEAITLNWSKVNEKDFMLLNPIADIHKTIFTKNNEKVNLFDYIDQWIQG